MSSHSAGRAILCADIGTSSLKAALVDFEGHLLAFAREGYSEAEAAAAAAAAAEAATAADWEAAFRRASRALSAQGREAGLSVDAVCISGNGPTLVPVTYSGEALAPLHWHDGRTAQKDRDSASPRPKSFFLPRAAWMRESEAETYAQVRRFISCHEWLSSRLGAEEVAVLPSPAYGPYFWDADQIETYGLDADKFAPLVLMGQRIGKVSASAARDFDLKEGTPIISAGTDYFMALVGVGVVEKGMVCDRAGTSEGINVCADKPARAAGLLTLPQLKNELWHVSAMLPTTGRLFEWFRTITGQTNRSYRDMLQEIETAAPRAFEGGSKQAHKAGSGGFFFPDVRSALPLPSQSGSEVYNGLSISSAFISTAGLTTRPELGRAVVEAIGFMVRDAIGNLERHGFRIEGMRLSGGQAKNDVWNKLKADITGRWLAVPEVPDGELIGNACAALLALGEVNTFEEAIERTVRIERVYEPDQRAYAVHSERYDAYRIMRAKMERFFE